MGKITGFLEFARLQEAAEPAAERVRHYREGTSKFPSSSESWPARSVVRFV